MERALGARRGRGVKTTVAYFVEAIRQDMLDKPSDEGHGGQCDGVAIFGAKGNGTLRDIDEAAVGDRDAMGVAPQIGQDVVDAAEGFFDVDDPVVTGKTRDKLFKGSCVTKWMHAIQRARLFECAELGDQFAAKQCSHDLDGEKKRGMGWDPPGTVLGQHTGRNNGMDMGMKTQVPRPGMKHRRDTQLPTEAGLSEFEQGLAGCTHQRGIDFSAAIFGQPA